MTRHDDDTPPRKTFGYLPAKGRYYWEQRKKALERDGHRCTHIDAQGGRCAETRAEELTMHHKTWRSRGGNHGLSNLQTLCVEHHLLLHPTWRKEHVMEDREFALGPVKEFVMPEREL